MESSPERDLRFFREIPLLRGSSPFGAGFGAGVPTILQFFRGIFSSRGIFSPRSGRRGRRRAILRRGRGRAQRGILHRGRGRAQEPCSARIQPLFPPPKVRRRARRCYIYASYTRTYVLTYVYTYLRTYTRTYVRTYIHTYIHTHTYRELARPTRRKGEEEGRFWPYSGRPYSGRP